MARISGISERDRTPEILAISQKQEATYGSSLNPLPILGLRPTILEGTDALAAGIAASGLIEVSLKRLVSLKTAIINGCPF